MKIRVIYLVAALSLVSITSCNRNPVAVSQRDIRLGQKYFDHHRYDEASLEFRRALQANPHSADAEYRLGLSYAQLHRWREAYAAFSRATEIDPSHLEARIQLAELELAGNQLQDAQQDVAEIMKLDKANVEGLILRGRLYVQEKSYQDAARDFIQASQLAPRDPRTLNYLAGTYALNKQYKDAEKTYQQAIELNPAFYVSYVNLAGLYAGEGEPAQEEASLLSAIKQNPSVVSLYMLLADFYSAQGNSARVSPLFTQLRAATRDSLEASLGIAQFYESHGQESEARTALTQLLSKNGANIEARKALIGVDLDLQQTSEAEKLDGELLKANPSDPEGRLYQGRLLLSQGKTAEAITVLQHLVHDEPDMTQAYYGLGLAYGQRGDVDQEIANWKEGLARDANPGDADIELAQLYIQREDGREALSYANESLKRNPRSLIAALTRANAELLLGQSQAAEQELGILAAADPNSPAIQERLGYAQLLQRKFTEASSHFEQALKLQPDFFPAMKGLCLLYQAQGNLDEAISRVQQQIQRVPQQGYFYQLLGDVYQSMGDIDRAAEAYKGALAHVSKADAAMSYARLAQLCNDKHDYLQAIANAGTSIAENPDLLPAYVVEGEAYENLGQFDQAKRAYQVALARNSNFVPALNNLAWLECEHGGNLDEALSFAEHAKQLQPADPDVSDTLAWIDYRKGLYGSALPLASDAASHSPSDGQFQYHLGMILMRTGDRGGAREALQRALQSPQLTTADAELARRALGATR
jgi:tetratricopeptide (TPR) repeat protein